MVRSSPPAAAHDGDALQIDPDHSRTQQGDGICDYGTDKRITDT